MYFSVFKFTMNTLHLSFILHLLHAVAFEEAFRASNSGVISFGNFFHHKDHKLVAATLKDERVESSDECLVRCVQTHGCLSVNVNTTGDDQGLYVCELLASDKYENQSNFRPSKGIDHYSIANPCEKKPCQHRGKCVPFYTNHTYKCECPAGTLGQDCQITGNYRNCTD
ncbi:EGF-like repeat and discoidin I-like domain-containing protein 3 [Actinia tenebrosa]|uniref:EGF-like repeat and discoidin I-like domain-containing protein 3 n=1 Tax=Actinia tenebrosa TaxID=6105 RepID=A0A6P8IN68_ACTTE|nr:EGF-like repeat and discoidin I-like domain-containing protein 3 [Actinia tenebrosa]